MIEFTQQLYNELLLKLEDSDQRLNLITEAIDQIKQQLKTYQFATEEEEIQFFKNLLPLFLSLFVYYSEKAALGCCERIGTEKSRMDYLDLLFQRIDYFFKANEEFFNYYRFGKTKFDNHYFLRTSYLFNENLDLPVFLMDSSFCTIYSWKLATIMAYTQLEKEISFNVKGKNSEGVTSDYDEEGSQSIDLVKLEWTDPKMGLIELVYSLRKQGAFNHGKADLKTITRYFEKVFSVQLSNTSKSFQDILSRKKNYTTYLDKLRDKMVAWIDEIEDRNMKR
jgi:RteC protein